MDPIALAGLALAGFLAWGPVEYLVHGALSHRWRTFVTPLHWGHHREPRAVFTSPFAWVPIAAALFAALGAAAGPAMAGALGGGLLVGFLHYEYAHWRIHFRTPRSERQRILREHHLAHHYRDPTAYHGVTTRLWDRVFGTLPAHWREDYACVADRAPLPGPSNLWSLLSPAQARAILRARRPAPPDGPV